MRRPVILTSATHYLPGFRAGGPVRSIANLVEALGDEFEFRILCSDRDLGAEAPYPGITADRWLRVGKAWVRYVSPQRRTAIGITRLLRETPYDLLYLNALFSPRFTIAPLVARRLLALPPQPVVLAPRGALSEGALALKAGRKRARLASAARSGLLRGLVWQASSQYEAADISAALGEHAPLIRVAGDLAAVPPAEPPQHTPRAPGAPLRVAFVSRISPMKNLDYALRVLALVETPVMFCVHGPREDEAYAGECERLAAALPAHVTVRWHGAVEPAQVGRVMAEHDLFLLPTRGENFGHAVAEALAAGTPVLLSDRTPWRGLGPIGVGEDLALDDPARFAAAIEAQARLSPSEARERRARAFAHASERGRAGMDVEANRHLFAAALKAR